MYHHDDYDKIPGSKLYRRHCEKCGEPIRVTRAERHGPAMCHDCNPMFPPANRGERRPCSMVVEPEAADYPDPPLMPCGKWDVRHEFNFSGPRPSVMANWSVYPVDPWPAGMVWRPIPGLPSMIDAARRRLVREGRIVAAPLVAETAIETTSRWRRSPGLPPNSPATT